MALLEYEGIDNTNTEVVVKWMKVISGFLHPASWVKTF